MSVFSFRTRSFMPLSSRSLAIFVSFALILSTWSSFGHFYPLDTHLLGVPLTSDTSLPTHIPAELPTIAQKTSHQAVAFVPNVGQTDPLVYFQSHTMGGTIFFTQKEVVLSLPTEETQLQGNYAESPPPVVRLQFQGANATPDIVGGEKLPGVVNYLYGDSKYWHTNVPIHQNIMYKNIYPGIDLRYDGTEGRLKGTYLVAPGANPSMIQWNYQGATNVSLNKATGHLHIGLANTPNPLIEQAPVAWQEIEGKLIPVTIHYVLNHENTVSFALGAYNLAYPLIIDPALIYSTYLGGSKVDKGNDIVVDQSEGSVYVVGETRSSDFPIVGKFSQSYKKVNQDQDIFVTKINVYTNALVYSTYIGGAGNDVATSVALDTKGNAYVTGYTDSYDANDLTKTFPITATYKVSNTLKPAFQTKIGGGIDAFVAKVAPNGSSLEYSTYLGGSGEDRGLGIAVYLGSNNIYQEQWFPYVTGSTGSKNFPVLNPIPSGQSLIGGTGTDAFVTKIDPNGQELEYSTYVGGTNSDFGNSIDVDGAGNAYVTGGTNSSDLISKTNELAGDQDAFLIKIHLATKILTPSATLEATTMLSTSLYLGGTSNDNGKSLVVDKDQGIAYITGSTSSLNYPVKNSLMAPVTGTLTYDGSKYSGDTDAFFTIVDKNGKDILYSTYLGGFSKDEGRGIARDADGNVYITGLTESPSFPEYLPPPQITTTGGGSDAFITVISKEKQYREFLYTSGKLGGTGTDSGNAVDAFGSGDQSYAFIVGNTTSNNFPLQYPLYGTYRNDDAFISKIGWPKASLSIPAEGVDVLEKDQDILIPVKLALASSTPTIIKYHVLKKELCGADAAGDNPSSDYDFFVPSDSIFEQTIPENQTTVQTGTFKIHIVDDTLDEIDERICVQITTGYKEVLAVPIFIVDNDGPQVQFEHEIAPGGFAEPVTGVNTGTLHVQLSATSPQTIEVPIVVDQPKPGVAAAQAGTDYTLYTRKIVFPPNTTTQPVEVLINADNVKERDEFGSVAVSTPDFGMRNGKPFSNAIRATLGKPISTTFTILRNVDTPVRIIRFSEPRVVTVTEEIGKPNNATFGVESDGLFGSDVFVGLQTGGSAIKGKDYTLPDNFKLDANQQRFQFTVPVSDDLEIELAETIEITLTNLRDTDLITVDPDLTKSRAKVVIASHGLKNFIPFIAKEMSSTLKW